MEELKKLDETGVRVFDAYRKREITVRARALFMVADYRGITKLTGQKGSSLFGACQQCELVGFNNKDIKATVYPRVMSFLTDAKKRSTYVTKMGFTSKDLILSWSTPAPVARTKESIRGLQKLAHEHQIKLKDLQRKNDEAAAGKKKKPKETKNKRENNDKGAEGLAPLAAPVAVPAIEHKPGETLQTHRQALAKYGYNGYDVLHKLPYIDPVYAYVNDPMHILTNVIKHVLDQAWNTSDYTPNRKAYEERCGRNEIVLRSKFVGDNKLIAEHESDDEERKRPLPAGAPPSASTPYSMKSRMTSYEQIKMSHGTAAYHLDFYGIDDNVVPIYQRLMKWINNIAVRDPNRALLDELQREIVVILSELETMLPTCFMTIQLHLLLHQVEQIKRFGSIYNTWMMINERFCGYLLDQVYRGGKELQQELTNAYHRSSTLAERSIKASSFHRPASVKPQATLRLSEPTGNEIDDQVQYDEDIDNKALFVHLNIDEQDPEPQESSDEQEEQEGEEEEEKEAERKETEEKAVEHSRSSKGKKKKKIAPGSKRFPCYDPATGDPSPWFIRRHLIRQSRPYYAQHLKPNLQQLYRERMQAKAKVKAELNVAQWESEQRNKWNSEWEWKPCDRSLNDEEISFLDSVRNSSMQYGNTASFIGCM